MPRRVVEVAPDRYAAWRSRFDSANPGPEAAQRVEMVERFDHDPLVVVLVRRGGYAVGLARGGRLGVHKVGSRYVQSRTAAGGWSQQRFARRRANQADALVRSVAEQVVRVLPDGMRSVGPLGGLVLGGDRTLCAEVLTDARLAWLAELPRRELYDLGDPRLDQLRRAVERGSAIRVTIGE